MGEDVKSTWPIDAYGNCMECGGGPEGSIPHDYKCSYYDEKNPWNNPYGMKEPYGPPEK